MPDGPTEFPRAPSLPGPWKSLDSDEASAVLKRLARFLPEDRPGQRSLSSQPVVALRAMPLACYPGWLLLEGESLLDTNEVGTFNALYGPEFMWLIDGDSRMFHIVNSGKLAIAEKPGGGDGEPESVSMPTFMPSPLAPLDVERTGPDYLRLFCASVWATEGPFWAVEDPDSLLLKGARFPDDQWRKFVRPMEASQDGDSLIMKCAVIYAGNLFDAVFSVSQNGTTEMKTDNHIATTGLPPPRCESPFRDIRTIRPEEAEESESDEPKSALSDSRASKTSEPDAGGDTSPSVRDPAKPRHEGGSA